jgi:SAM-dependent methyltransferase
MSEASFEEALRWATGMPFEGWDFSALEGRHRWGDPRWSYAAVVKELINEGAESLLDLGTGGGEFLAGLAPLPKRTVAAEAWAPNVPVATRNLAPLGVEIVHYPEFPGNGEQAPGQTGPPFLPFGDHAFDLVICRHECYLPTEVHRVLRPGGVFATQQLGGEMTAAVHELFGRPRPQLDGEWGPEVAEAQIRAAGFELLRLESSTLPTQFFEVGALVYWLKAAPWELPDFDLERDRTRLLALHRQCERAEPIELPTSYLLLVARA